MSRFAFQEPKKVVEHYAAGEGEGEEAPKVTLLLFLSVPSLLASVQTENELPHAVAAAAAALAWLTCGRHGCHAIEVCTYNTRCVPAAAAQFQFQFSGP